MVRLKESWTSLSKREQGKYNLRPRPAAEIRTATSGIELQ